MLISRALSCAVLLAVVTSIHAQAPKAATPATRPVPSITWTSTSLDVGLDTHGLITTLHCPTDPAAMNWVREAGPAWGVPMSREEGKLMNWDSPEVVSSEAAWNEVRFVRGALAVSLKQSLGEERLRQAYTLTNRSEQPVTLGEGDFGIRIPLPDNYPDAKTCVTNRCDVHLWAGGSSSWINAVRMGGTAPHLGLVLTEGAWSAYSITDRPWNSNDRGTFVVHPPAMTLQPGQSMTLAWTVFVHGGWDDFFKKAAESPTFVRLQADRYTVLPGEAVRITAEAGTSLEGATLTVNGKPFSGVIQGNRLAAAFVPSALGDQNVELTVNGRTSRLRAFASADPMALIEARCRFLVEHQQRHAPTELVDGAFLAYDNETNQQVLEKSNDRNAGRERVGMGILVALYIPLCTDKELKNRLLECIHNNYYFVTHHLQDATGKVFNNTDDPKQRLYNYPWVARLHLAMYEITRDSACLDAFMRTINSYYANDGGRFYPIGMPLVDGYRIMEKAGRTEDCRELYLQLITHAEHIVERGLNLPKHEVNYEQSIVAPACDILLQAEALKGDGRFREAAKPFVAALEAFNGQQPDFHLNDVAIRHWDDYWFGKSKLYGDTFPHYWSTITAVVFNQMGPADAGRTQDILANNLSLFSPDGRASCAYVYPLTVNDKPGRFYDAWANDQDWALVHYLLIHRK